MTRLRIGYILVVTIVIAFIALPFLGFNSDAAELSPAALILLILATGSALILWVWMISDLFINRRAIKFAFLWGCALVVLNWFAAVIYFLGNYSIRLRKSLQADVKKNNKAYGD
jgi:hypothetical protein